MGFNFGKLISDNVGYGKPGTDTLPLGTGLLAVVFTLLLFYLGPGHQLSLLLYAALFMLVAFIGLFLRWVAGVDYRLTRVHLVVMFSLVWVCLNVLWSLRADNAFFFAWEYSFFALGFFVLSYIEEKQWQRLVGLMFLPLAVSALWGIIEYAVERTRANGPLIDPNLWAALNNLSFFSLTVLIFKTRGKATYWQLALLFIFALALFAGYSRVANLVHLVALLFLSVAGFYVAQYRKKMMLILVVSLLAFGVIQGMEGEQDATHSEGYTLDIEQQGWSERLAIWSSAIHIYQDHPLLGSGFGTFKFLYPAHRSEGDLRTLGNFVHNDYLQVLVEAGPVGLMLMLVWVIYLLVWLFRYCRLLLQEKEQARALEAIVLILAMGTILSHALMSFVLLQASVLLLMATLFARLVQINGCQQASKSLPGSYLNHPGLIKGLVTAGACLVWLLLLMDTLSFSVIYGQKGIPFVHQLREEPQRRVALVKILKAVRPGTPINHLDLARIYEASISHQPDQRVRERLALMAAFEYEQSLGGNPYSLMTLYYYAALREAYPWLDKADGLRFTRPAIFDHGVAVAPTHVETSLRKADYLEERGRRKAAYRQLKQAMPWVDVRHTGYEEPRLEYLKRLAQMAERVGDKDVLSFVSEKLN